MFTTVISFTAIMVIYVIRLVIEDDHRHRRPYSEPELLFEIFAVEDIFLEERLRLCMLKSSKLTVTYAMQVAEK